MIRFNWSDIDGMTYLLWRKLLGTELGAIVGIARSGLTPAVMLSHALGVRDLAVLDIVRTLNDNVEAEKSEPIVRGFLGAERIRGRKVLLVDDIVGEGRTFACARAYLADKCASVTTAALVSNLRNRKAGSVDHVACITHSWVIFPWEAKGFDDHSDVTCQAGGQANA